ncbi:MAG TPA: SIMPL domain-containing protein, partial [Roseimicrobium sp.]|nr:SIMPL domain-containing protein [Roseimicrobium sp.]
MNTEDPSKPARSRRRFFIRPIGTVCIAIAVVWSTAIAAGTWRDVRGQREKNNIRVTGSAKKRIVSDLIQWEATIEGRAPDRTAAYQVLRAGRDKAVAFLIAQGIKA